jgi:hypothetical protein
MSLYETIVDAYPELSNSDAFVNGTILLQDDSDGLGAYVAQWNYEKPIPDGLIVGK